ncbi:hypothetical protein D3C76_1506520 [compost metagenome]
MIISWPSSSSIRMVTEPLTMNDKLSALSPAQMILLLAAKRRRWQWASSLSMFLIFAGRADATMAESR